MRDSEQHQLENNVISSTLQALPDLGELVGREDEMGDGLRLLARPEIRLLTVTGVGGVGKTRLAQELARQVAPAFADGVFMLSLAALSQPDQLLPALLQVFGLRTEPAYPLLATLVAFLRDRQALLLLDTFEQIVLGATLLVELLARCPRIKLLVTSREMLRVRGEHVFQLDPLPLPDLTSSSDEAGLAENAAVRLFTRHMRALRSSESLSSEDVRASAEICIRLDGLPLAIELASARCVLFAPRELLTRLERRLPLLTHGPRDLPERQQTLRDTLVWSYNLLAEQEQRLFTRMAIFAGGCTLAAAQALYVDDPGACLDGITSLLEKNLLRRVESPVTGPRLRMLETLRELGLECLRASGEEHEIRNRHASYYLQLAEQAEPIGPDDATWLSCLDLELDNVRGALQWWDESGDAVNVLRMGAALRYYWISSGHAAEGYGWITQTLDRTPGCTPVVRAQALLAAGMLAPYQAQYTRWWQLCQESRHLFQELGDGRGMAEALNELGLAARWHGELARAHQFHAESLNLWRACADQQGIASTQLHLARVLYAQSGYHAARELTLQSLQHFRVLGQRQGIARSLMLLAFIVSYYQEHRRALMLAEESLDLFRALGVQWEMAGQLQSAAKLALRQNDSARALAYTEESLVVARRAGNREAVASGLHLLALLRWKRGAWEEGRQLLTESLVLYEELDCQEGIADVLLTYSQLASVRKEYTEARMHLERCLRILLRQENKPALIASLVTLARLAAREGRTDWSIRLLAASDALREAIGRQPFPLTDAYRRTAMLVASIPEKREFTSAWRAGRAMTPAQAVAAREESPLLDPSPRSNPTHFLSPVHLTAREREVLHLITLGLTNPQIARLLLISPVTVNAHVRSIYDKLAVSSRSAATRYALQHHLF
ncbi:LuxR C-terminal-related transcriptional regulator [Dictyobacter aurantiacus]|uniref:HTH luxR-type domain-containing protein n=1 Tax=Dictyobacter aurantiacus TaxID=1936993 RepID=A0A401ZJI0_9CHLR|nr:LuxR C-terminal-related transcriptional regulator [Dictyobacter aurantiacus]GCE06999.1 hypothetical protein KDAU_43280 [Dictyobacter aurantiacus]